jgi:hypothetical protein
MPHDKTGPSRLASAEVVSFALARNQEFWQRAAMRILIAAIGAGLLLAATARATTLMVVPVFEPLSLQGTDGEDAVSDTGDALQACVMARPMALTGAFPEVLVDAIRSPHLIPSNQPTYKVQETNLLVLCNIGITGTMAADGLTVRLDVGQLIIPPKVDLTSRQILKLTIVAVKKTLEDYQRPQTQPLSITLIVEGTGEANSGLRDLGTHFVLGVTMPPK